MIKLIASDMDGTLLNESMEISPENVKMIKEVQAKGLEFIVATGRAHKESLPIVKQVGLKTGFINLNGAMVYDENGKLVIKHPIETSKALKLAKLLKKAGFYFEIITADEVYSDSQISRIESVANLLVDLNPYMSFQRAVTLAAGSPTIMNIKFVPSLIDLIKNDDLEVMKVMAFDGRGPSAFTQIKKDILKLKDLVVASSSSENIEINSIKAQKGLALLDYAKTKGLDRAQVAAIGDNLNDANMILNAGFGIAMNNAVPKIKTLAQWETKSNANDGVAYALKHILKMNQEN